MYRYRYERCLSRFVLERFQKHFIKLGTITKVVAKRYGAWRKGSEGKYYTTYEVLMVYGDKGTARFTGCCWGYGGEGPRAVNALLKAMGVPDVLADHYAFRVPRLDKVGVDWTIADVDRLATPRVGS